MILGIHQSLSNFSAYLASSSLPCLQCSLWSRSQIKKNENNKTVSMKIYDRKKKKRFKIHECLWRQGLWIFANREATVRDLIWGTASVQGVLRHKAKKGWVNSGESEGRERQEEMGKTWDCLLIFQVKRRTWEFVQWQGSQQQCRSGEPSNVGWEWLQSSWRWCGGP